MKKRFSLLITTLLLGCAAQKAKVNTKSLKTIQGLSKLKVDRKTLTTKLSTIKKRISFLEEQMHNSQMVSINDLIGSYHGQDATSINDFISSHYENEMTQLERIKKNLESKIALLKLKI